MRYLTPREIVEALDKYIIGQDKAKKAVAIALRNRYRRSMLPRYDLEALSKTRVFLAFINVECLLGYTPPEETP
mgnify:CR=1 FL=1